MSTTTNASNAAAATGTTAKQTRARYGILAMLFVVGEIKRVTLNNT